MRRILEVVICVFSVAISHGSFAQDQIKTRDLADKVLEKALVETDLELYPGSLLLQAMGELALVENNDALLKKTIGILQKFGTGELEGKGSFISYQSGGSGAAYLRYNGMTELLESQVTDGAERMIANQRRSSEGLLMPGWVKQDQVFIDMAFAVTPFLLYAGLVEDKKEYIDLAVLETLELIEILKDEKTGLLHQCGGCHELGEITEDNWSRGNGWGAVGLGALLRDLSTTHPKRNEVERVAKKFFLAVLEFKIKMVCGINN